MDYRFNVIVSRLQNIGLRFPHSAIMGCLLNQIAKYGASYLRLSAIIRGQLAQL